MGDIHCKNKTYEHYKEDYKNKAYELLKESMVADPSKEVTSYHVVKKHTSETVITFVK